MERTHCADFIQIRNKRAKTSNNDLDKEINPGAAPLSGTSADFTETERAAVQLYKVSFQDYLPEKQLWGFVYWWKCRLKLLFCGFVAQWLGEKGYSFSSIVSELSQITSIIGDSGRGFIFANGYIDFCELSEISKAVKSPEKHPGMKSKFCFYICVMFQGFQGEGAVTIEYMKHVHSLIALTSWPAAQSTTEVQSEISQQLEDEVLCRLFRS